ncbi:hypothetical protein DOTSEDRAFT_28378 [Dothistroma septosporum NZE10]|uniref:Uncharacterized protein n=1 Tax=Dothistroma septosporum (strain NZE10 / CBS 128990) TaxID=675120 RepID=M2Y1M2_DOTSN|nr:hypothetical protein DOTSEDRAFT_28378 [Dothistroma septosporum NZE10]
MTTLQEVRIGVLIALCIYFRVPASTGTAVAVRHRLALVVPSDKIVTTTVDVSSCKDSGLASHIQVWEADIQRPTGSFRPVHMQVLAAELCTYLEFSVGPTTTEYHQEVAIIDLDDALRDNRKAVITAFNDLPYKFSTFFVMGKWFKMRTIELMLTLTHKEGPRPLRTVL